MLLKIEFDDNVTDQILNMVKICGMNDIQELLNNSLTLMQWAVAEEQSSRNVGSLDLVKDNFELIRLDALDNIREVIKYRNRSKNNPKKGPNLRVVK